MCMHVTIYVCVHMSVKYSWSVCGIVILLPWQVTVSKRKKKERKGKHPAVEKAVMCVMVCDGVCRYWRGCTPTVARAIVVNVTQVGIHRLVYTG